MVHINTFLRASLGSKDRVSPVMARSGPGPPEACKSNGFISGNSSHYCLTEEDGWKASGYADPIEEERGSMPPHADDPSNNGIYSSSGSRPDVYSSWQGSDQFLNQVSSIHFTSPSNFLQIPCRKLASFNQGDDGQRRGNFMALIIYSTA